MFSFSFRWLQMRDSWSSGPYSTSRTLFRPNKQTFENTPKRAESVPAVGRTCACCEPTLALLSSRLQQLVTSLVQSVSNIFPTPSWLQTTFLTSFTDTVQMWLTETSIDMMVYIPKHCFKAKNRHISLSATSEQRHRSICFRQLH